MRSFIVVLAAGVVCPHARAQRPVPARGQVMVYRGPGACEGCSDAPAEIAARLGLPVRFVNARHVDDRGLPPNAIWIQPGGDALVLERQVTPRQKNILRRFVERGGAYVGFCAGAFFADTTIDDQHRVPGLGLIPGETYDFLPHDRASSLPIVWGNEFRWMFYQAGPAFRLFPQNRVPVEVLARYRDGSPAAIRFRFGAGKVVLSGPHPEASAKWFAEERLPVPARLSEDLAARMIQWAAEP